MLLGHGYPIRKEALAKALEFAPEGGEVRLKLTRPAIRAELHRLFGAAERQPHNARFAVGSDGGIDIIESSAGREVDADTVRQALEQNPAMRQIPVRIADIKPSFATADARGCGSPTRSARFTTPYSPGEPRVTNIQRAAEELDGFILGAGETFSLNAVLGPRTTEAGYVLAPQIEEGKLKDAVGGGVSQVATTLYNAAFMSGLALVAHTPHEFWISRYPRGREATVSWGGPELVFVNDWDAPLVMLVEAGDSEHHGALLLARPEAPRRVRRGRADRLQGADGSARSSTRRSSRARERVLQQSGDGRLHDLVLAQGVPRRRPDPRRDVRGALQARGPRSSRSGRRCRSRRSPDRYDRRRTGTGRRRHDDGQPGAGTDEAPAGTDEAAPAALAAARRRRCASCGRWRPSRPRAAATPTSTA